MTEKEKAEGSAMEVRGILLLAAAFIQWQPASPFTPTAEDAAYVAQALEAAGERHEKTVCNIKQKEEA